jgi:hypothetical protein
MRRLVAEDPVLQITVTHICFTSGSLFVPIRILYARRGEKLRGLRTAKKEKT